MPIVNLSMALGDFVLYPGGVRSTALSNTSPVEVDQSGFNTLLACPQPVADPAVADQFYLNGEDALLRARVFQAAPGVEYFKNQCFKLPIIASRVLLADGSVENLNPRDGNPQFPESRRCIVFKTV